MIPLDVIIIGAGLSGKQINGIIFYKGPYSLTYHAGICAGIELKSKFENVTFGIFDREDDIRGTWSKNTYPNLSCDIPSQVRHL